MKLSVNAIKKKYPNPKANWSDWDDYCVGGAFCKYLGHEAGFPLPGFLRDQIMQVNKKLPTNTAYKYARGIIRNNDRGNFKRAWDILREALKETK